MAPGADRALMIGREPPLSADKAATHLPLIRQATAIPYDEMLFFAQGPGGSSTPPPSPRIVCLFNVGSGRGISETSCPTPLSILQFFILVFFLFLVASLLPPGL